MKTALIVYFSQGGTTATVATAISKGLKDRGYDTDLYSITDDAPPNVAEYDLIGIGSPVYIYRPPFNVTAFVNDLPNLNGRPFFVFMLHGTHPGTAGNILRKHLEHKGGREVGYSLYRGADYFVGYVQRGVLFSPDIPVPDELERARRFVKEVAEYASGKAYDQPPEDRLPPAVYTLEQC
jgi:flavodoxin